MKIIRISTENEISVHDFPEGSFSNQNRILRELIGSRCDIYERVMPRRLYKELGGSNKVSRKKGECVSMLVDEEGLLSDLDVNMVGSYLYETDKHGNPIVGNILIIGEWKDMNGISFCGMSEQQFNLLYPKLEKITKRAREHK